MSFATRFVYVGIGGSGLKVGKALERLLREEICGPDGRALIGRGGTFATLQPFQLPDFVQTLYLDFSEQDLVSLQNDLLPMAPEVALRTATFVNSLSSAGHSSADVTDLLRVSKSAAEATAHWLPPKTSEWGTEPTFAPLSTGAGQYPTIGRAALFAYMERFGAESLLRDFRRPLERIVGSIGQLEEYAGANTSSRNVVFLIGCSLSGGTGGGIFLDTIRLIAHEAASQLGETPFVIVPLVLLPSAFDNVLAPSKKKNASLNATRALADLGRLIDRQNAPTTGDGHYSATYPGGHGGRGTLELILPPATVKTAFLFHRPADVPNDGALSERVARFAANLLRQPSVSKLASGPLGSGRTMTLLDKLVNNAGLLQERHPTFIGRRPFASAACVAIPDGRDQLIDLVTDQLLSTYLTDTARGLSDEERERRLVAVQSAAGLNPPSQAPIDARWRQELTNVATVDEETVSAAYASFLSALRQVMPPLGAKKNGVIPEQLSAGAHQAVEHACRYGDSGSVWIDLLDRAAIDANTDLVGILPAAKETAGAWAAGRLVGKPKRRNTQVMDFPDPRALIRIERQGLLGRSQQRVLDETAVQQLRYAEASQVDATWRNYLENPQGVAVKLTTAAGLLRGRVDNVLRELDQWAQHSTTETQVDRQSEVRDRYAYGPDFQNLFDKVIAELGAQLGVAQPSPTELARHILRRRQPEIIEVWKNRDSGDAAMLPVRLKEAISKDVKQAFTQTTVYAGIEQILRDWAATEEGRFGNEVQEFRTKMLASITDSMVPPALDREIEPMVTVAYPGEQNSRVEERLADALATQASFARYLRLAAPTFVPRAAGNALIISVSLVGQGLVDVPDGAQGLNTWVESAFRPDPTDRLAWRQREGFKDAIDFLDATARAELLQRMLAAAWNGELTADRLADEPARRFRALHLRFGAADAPSLTISLEDMPFATTLAPLVDAYLRAISSRYLTDTDAVSEILRELARVVPRGFVERRQPTDGELRERDLFLDFIRELSTDGAGDREYRELQDLQDQLADQSRNGSGQAKRTHQINEYFEFWDRGVPEALRLSFGTLGYGTFEEVIREIQQARAADARSA